MNLTRSFGQQLSWVTLGRYVPAVERAAAFKVTRWPAASTATCVKTRGNRGRGASAVQSHRVRVEDFANEPRPRGETVAPADRSEGCRVHVLPRPTHPAPTLTRLATVRQKSRSKTHTMIFG